MTSNRLLRVVRARWWLLAIIIIGTTIIAVNLVGARNRSILPSEATAGITFNRLVDETDDVLLQERLAVAGEVALEVNPSEVATGVDPLTPVASAEIKEDPQSARLLFIGRGPTDSDAAEIAFAMRSRFLEAQALDGSEAIDTRIAVVSEQLDSVIEAISARTEEPPISEAELAWRIQIRQLQAELSALTNRYGALTVELVTPLDPPRSPVLIESERAAMRREIADTELALLNAEAGEIPIPPEDSQLLLLRSEEMQLRTALDTLVAQRIEAQSIGTLDPVEFAASDVQAIRSLPVVALGLLLGLLVAAAGLIVLDRARRPVWELADLPPQDRLPEIAMRPRPYGDQATKPWYPTAPQGQRKSGIQALRSAVEGLPPFGSGLAIGVASLTSRSTDTHELAADLASSIASSGTTALLLDTDFGSPTDLIEYRLSGCELTAAMADPHTSLAEASNDGEAGIAAGVSISKQTVESPDILAQPNFARLLQVAKSMYGAIIVACPPSTTAGYHILTQRLDAMILVTPIGHSLPDEVETAVRTLADRRATPLGVTLLTHAGNPVGALFGRLRDAMVASSEEPPSVSATEDEVDIRQQPNGGAQESTDQEIAEAEPQPRETPPPVADRVTIISVEDSSDGGADPGIPDTAGEHAPPLEGAATSGAETRPQKSATKASASADPSVGAAVTDNDSPRIDIPDSTPGPGETDQTSAAKTGNRKTESEPPDEPSAETAPAASTSTGRTRKKRASVSNKAASTAKKRNRKTESKPPDEPSAETAPAASTAKTLNRKTESEPPDEPSAETAPAASTSTGRTRKKRNRKTESKPPDEPSAETAPAASTAKKRNRKTESEPPDEPSAETAPAASTAKTLNRKTESEPPDEPSAETAPAASTSTGRTRKKRASVSNKAASAEEEQAVGAD